MANFPNCNLNAFKKRIESVFFMCYNHYITYIESYQFIKLKVRNFSLRFIRSSIIKINKNQNFIFILHKEKSRHKVNCIESSF